MRQVLYFIFALSLTLTAQEPSPTPIPTPVPTPTPPPGVRVQFSVFVWPTEGILLSDSVIEGLPRTFYEQEGRAVPVRLLRNRSTPLLPYYGQLPLTLFDVSETITDPPPDAPPDTPPTVTREKVPVINARFPRSWDRVLLVVFPGRQAADGTLLTLALPYDQQALRPGMARIFNASEDALVLNFPETDQQVVLQPNAPVDFNPRNLTASGFARVFVYRNNGQGDLDMVHTSRLFFDPDTTNYFFIYPQGRRRFRLMRLAGHPGETQPAPEPEPEP